MKASFKKLTLLIFHRERESVTETLQKIGLLHLEVDTNFRNDDMEELERKKTNLAKTIGTIEEYAAGNPLLKPQKTHDAIHQIVKEVLDLKHRMEANVLKRETLRKEKLQRTPWGDFDSKKLQRLAGYGLNVRFCIAAKKDFKKYDFGSLACQVVHESTDQVYFVVIAKDEVSLPFETIKVPETALSGIAAEEQNIEAENRKIEQEIALHASYSQQIRSELIRVEDELAFAMANGSYLEHGEGSILSLTGWYPEGLEEKLVKYLKKENLVYSIEEPGPDSKVPVLLKNRSFPKLFEPVTKIFELPNYYELDLTPLIAVFYPIMFAYCLGDAGYGLVFLAAALIGWFSFLKNSRRIAILGIILGLFTTAMGIVKSGSVFGIPTTVNDSWVVFQYLRQFVIIPDDRNFIFNAFNVSLMIGVVQIFTGIFISIANKLRYEGWVPALPQWGKLMIVTGLIWIFLADMQGMEIFQPFPVLRKVLAVGGALMVLLFHDMNQALFSRAASGLLPLFFILTGILGDILSYVRLFALGVASSVLGLVVNKIGMQIMENGWWGLAIGVVFLIFGHSLNFFIATLGAFVHPLRLTFVEFYNNAQFKGGGKEYRPFRKESLDINN